MATAPVSVDSLSKDERAIVVDALETLRASKVRAFNSSKDQEFRELMTRRVAGIDALIAKFR